MAKGIGLIGNFRGKVGNMVGYNLKDSNNKQTQGVRVYQPVVKNPKTAGQAEQRAKLAPINATYRALKMIIDRGQEGKAYGNKSRLAWLSAAMKAFDGGWFEKDAAITVPALIPLTKGSLPGFPSISVGVSNVQVSFDDTQSGSLTTMGALSAAIMDGNDWLHVGDQITFVAAGHNSGSLVGDFYSFVLVDSTDTTPVPARITTDPDMFSITFNFSVDAGTVIISREGNNGEHLRSTNSLERGSNYDETKLAPAAKAAAIASYMSAGANTDWAEESLQD